MPPTARALVVVLLVTVAGCNGDSPDDSPTAPSPPPAPSPGPAPPSTSTISATLTATNGGQPLGGITATLAGATTTTDGTGQFTFTVPATTVEAVLALSGGSIVPRRINLATRTRSVAVDAIQLAGGFSLDYYRQLVRNGHEQPGDLQPLRRWTEHPRVYIRSVFGASPMDESSLNTVESAVRDAVTAFTGGRLRVAEVERGTDSREGVPGWITVVWTDDLPERTCGTSFVGANPGRIRLHPRNNGCRCAGDPAQVSRGVIVHEVGHALGLYHTARREDVMFDTFNSCGSALSADERLHAPIAFSRPLGNIDPDTDPTGAVTSLPQTLQMR